MWVSMTVEPMISKGIKVPVTQSYPGDTKDLTTVLQAVKDANVDALIAFTYPNDTVLITEQAKKLGLNPKLLYLSIGCASMGYPEKFGPEAVQGIMALGAWNPKVSFSGAKEFHERYSSVGARSRIDLALPSVMQPLSYWSKLLKRSAPWTAKSSGIVLPPKLSDRLRTCEVREHFQCPPQR